MFQKEFEKDCFSFIFVKEEYGENIIEDIRKFMLNKKAFFFSGLDFGKQNNLNRLFKELNVFYENKEITKDNYSLENIFDYLITNSGNRQIWIFENIEEIIEEKDFSSIEKKLKELKQTNNMLIFISKSNSFFNKFTESKLVKYLSNSELQQINNFYTLKNQPISAEDKFKYYAIFGTKKEYRNRIDFNKSFKDNLINTFLNTNSFFYFEPNKILKKELRETQIYNIILEAVSKGASTLNEISNVLNMQTSICNKYITVLINLGIIKKIKPAFGKESRKSRYRISNPVMDFWYYFIPENISEIALNNGEKVFEEKIEKDIDSYLQMKFPDLCRDYIEKLKSEGKIKYEIKENNTWWNKNDSIDIVAGSGLEAIIADCYWKNEIVGMEELERLERKATEVDVIDREYYLFSRNGFSKELMDISKSREDIKLICFTDMISENIIEEKPRKRSFFFSKK